MRVKFDKKNIVDVIIAPPSKSYEQRVLACALLSRGNSYVTNFGQSDDVLAARSIIKVLGSETTIQDNVLHIRPRETSTLIELNCNESALCARMFAVIACIFKDNFIVTGKGSLLQRKIAEDFNILEQTGCKIIHNNCKIPIIFENAKLKNGIYTIDKSNTSQFVSGLLLSLPVCVGDSQIIVKNPVSINYILLSIEVARMFGVNISYEQNNNSELVVYIKGSQRYMPANIPVSIEGDWSGSAFLLAAGAIYKNIAIKGLNPNSIQPDKQILNVFDKANISYYWDNELLCVEKSNIKAFEFDAKDCPDLIPVLIILAVFADGISVIHGALRLINKESSRGVVMQQELAKLGIEITLDNDTIKIIGKQKPVENKVDSHNDHRIAMALSLMSGVFTNGLEIKNTESVKKSYPDFFNKLFLIPLKK